jgi:osmotically-inducible protein OsmY
MTTVEESIHRLKADHEIHKDVREELKWDLDITDQGEVDISVDHGVVTLDGYADSYAQKWAIEQATYRVHGVKGVQNYLEVRLPKDDDHSDREIERAARQALEWDARVPRGVSVHVSESQIWLSGSVERLAARVAAEDAVRNLVGVSGVMNEIKVIAGEPAADVKRDIEAAVRRRLDGGGGVSVVVADGVVTLSGVVPTAWVRDDIERAATLARGVTRVDDQLQVA